MGFRDLQNFNLSMLGKQGWRLLMNQNSLCARVLNGRYYHDGDFLTSTRRKHASHTWKAILAGREVLAQGLIKRVGDRTLTNIWGDRWIPNHFDARPLTPLDGQDIGLVSDLMGPNGRWDGAKIRQSFIPVDAEAILRIPTRPQVTNFWTWEPEKHGFYSVKSAHKMLDSRRIREEVVDTASVSKHDV